MKHFSTQNQTLTIRSLPYAVSRKGKGLLHISQAVGWSEVKIKLRLKPYDRKCDFIETSQRPLSHQQPTRNNTQNLFSTYSTLEKLKINLYTFCF